MEMSAVSVRRALPSTFLSSFSDQSHLQFYGLGRSSFLPPTNLRFKLPSRRSSAPTSVIVPIQAFSSSSCAEAVEPASEEALMKELAELKLWMKQKKKELKAQMKGEKKKMKVQMKEERKKKKQKDDLDGKTKMECDSESSGSESCDEECASVSMKMVRQNQATLVNARENSEGGPDLDNFVASSSRVLASSVDASRTSDTVVDSGEFQPSFSLLGSDATEACTGKSSMVLTDTERSELFLNVPAMGSYNGCSAKNGDMSPCKSRFDNGLGALPRALPPLRAANRIEVCTGGKCKKAGSQQLLLALQGQIPRSADVEAVPCKCMGKCSMAVNVRVLKEDTTPQHHSHVGVKDGSLILGHHFGLGCPSQGLPSLLPSDGIRVPSPLATA